jgi:transcriptional regulator with XRE-family HTH domain
MLIMNIGQRVRELRIARCLSQAELEGRTGLLRCYTSRVEHGHTIPSVETIEKYAIALGVSLATFFSNDVSPFGAKRAAASEALKSGPTSRERLESCKLSAALATMERRDRQFLVALARRLGKGSRMRRRKSNFRVA